MTTVDTPRSTTTGEPIDAVLERLNDPTVAASLVTLLDSAELLSVLAVGLQGAVARSESILDTVADGLGELRAVQARMEGMPSLAELRTVATELAQGAPAVGQIINSHVTDPATIALLIMVSEAATEGAEAASQRDTQIGPLGMLRALRDDDVQRGLGLVIEISRALGRKLDHAPARTRTTEVQRSAR